MQDAAWVGRQHRDHISWLPMAFEPGENSHTAQENLVEGRGRQYWLTSMAFGCFLMKLILNIDDHLRADLQHWSPPELLLWS